MLILYQWITARFTKPVERFLQNRLQKGKEDALRLDERKGRTEKRRPDGLVFWVHGASIGEAQSALILIQRLLSQNSQLHILVTTGTVTSAQYLQDRLPERAFHQFYPVDNPVWVERFLDHWRPDGVFWMESELWPNMLLAIQNRKIPAALINARLSQRSYTLWRFLKASAQKILSSFHLIIAQTPDDERRYRELGADNVQFSDNIKYSARALPCDETQLKTLTALLSHRPCWVFASTHAGEEEMATRIHQRLKNLFPELLTILIPRHPQRGADIEILCKQTGVCITRRTDNKIPPTEDTDIYIADTLGELGLFYRLTPIACIGRSFSNDGGGGHNPIEAAQLRCAILYGPDVQFQKNIYEEMQNAEAALQVANEEQLADRLQTWLQNEDKCESMRENAYRFAIHKEGAIDRIMGILSPLIQEMTAP